MRISKVSFSFILKSASLEIKLYARTRKVFLRKCHAQDLYFTKQFDFTSDIGGNITKSNSNQSIIAPFYPQIRFSLGNDVLMEIYQSQADFGRSLAFFD